MNDLRDTIILIMAVAFLTCIQAYCFLVSRTYKLNENANAIRLVDECVIEDIFPPLQSTRTFVLACQGTDAIRLWPLPVEKPWLEDE